MSAYVSLGALSSFMTDTAGSASSIDAPGSRRSLSTKDMMETLPTPIGLPLISSTLDRSSAFLSSASLSPPALAGVLSFAALAFLILCIVRSDKCLEALRLRWGQPPSSSCGRSVWLAAAAAHTWACPSCRPSSYRQVGHHRDHRGLRGRTGSDPVQFVRVIWQRHVDDGAPEIGLLTRNVISIETNGARQARARNMCAWGRRLRNGKLVPDVNQQTPPPSSPLTLVALHKTSRRSALYSLVLALLDQQGNFAPILPNRLPESVVGRAGQRQRDKFFPYTSGVHLVNVLSLAGGIDLLRYITSHLHLPHRTQP
ncbi:hypothetical protein KC351_g66 [Hortaea werneckii]|nr:hypothetical protein KC351_g66 [Hortaea werneckii]